MDVSRKSLYHWLLIQQWPGLSRTAFCRLLGRCDSVEALLALDDRVCLEAGAEPRWLAARRRGLSRNSPEARQAAASAGRLRDLGVAIIPWANPRYPALLREIPDPPPLLYCLGRVELLERPQLAMVGSRHASRAGLDTAREFAAALAGAGLAITSGLAHGIDAASHQGALAARGDTVAVLGTGIDVPYPARNRWLYDEIAERGLLVSEFAPGSPPRRSQFPQRNRIISGLSLGVFVVEAALRSGSLITARFALEQGRDVFALPGSVHSPGARGCHALIREGACLVETVQDIVGSWQGWHLPDLAVAPKRDSTQADTSAALSGEQVQVLEQLGFDPLPLDRLAELSCMAVEALLPQLMQLELEGWVERQGACWLRCR